MIGRETVFQHASCLRSWQYYEREYGATEESQQTIAHLQDELAEAIFYYKGRWRIDLWLHVHHRGHSRLSEIKGMDWSWLKDHPTTLRLRKK